MATQQLIGIYSGDLVGMVANVLKNLAVRGRWSCMDSRLG
jgi:anthranilate phosphoribosyltransferase